MRRAQLPQALIFLILLCAATLRAQVKTPSLGSDGEISVDAEELTYDRKADQVVARGKVVIQRGDTELRADEVRIDRPTNQAEAIGNVQLITPDGIVDAVEKVVDRYLELRTDEGEPFLAAYSRLGPAPFKDALYAAS